MRILLRGLIVSALVSCADAPADVGGLDSTTVGDAGSVERSPVPIPPAYRTINEVHEQAMVRTCSLNGGVCHNSKESPDLHTFSNLIAVVNQPCNLNVATKEDVRDACETEGDHLVIASANIDVEIKHIDITPEGVSVTKRSTDDGQPGPTIYESHPEAVISLAQPIAAFAFDQQYFSIEIRRGTQVFPIRYQADGYWDGVKIVRADSQSITVSLWEGYYSINTVNRFLDDRVYPWKPSMVRVGDVNGNGTIGRDRGVSLIVPGDALRSFLFLRLTDEKEGDLMPRVCREWDDRATRALGCWIDGLKTDAAGAVTNAEEPIVYAGCRFETANLGHCISGASIDAIFDRSCVGCHGQTNPAMGLDLSAANARANTVNKPSVEAPSMQLISPGFPDRSYLFCKVNPDATCRNSSPVMPSGGAPLSAEEISAIQSWILAGAN
jgi:hypothetical protein